MTQDDIKTQKAAALFAHQEALIARNHVKKRLATIAGSLRAIASLLETGHQEAFFRITGRRVGVSIPNVSEYAFRELQDSPEHRATLDYDSIAALMRELAATEAEVERVATEAKSLGVPV